MPEVDFEGILNDSSRSLADYVTSVVGADPLLFTRVLDLALKQKRQVSMRAARVADLACLQHPQLVRPHLVGIARALPGLTDHSVRRIMLHILIRHPWVEEDEVMGRLVDTLLKWIQDERQDVAIRSYSMDIMLKICVIEPELGHELALILQETMPDWGSETLRRQGRGILKKLVVRE
jgi:hypothetical protein